MLDENAKVNICRERKRKKEKIIITESYLGATRRNEGK
jgi:hypothetical protein